MDDLTTQAIQAAVAVAGQFGFKNLAPELLRDHANALVHLKPYPVVARVATTTGWLRRPAATWLARDLELATYLHTTGFPVVPPSPELPPGPHLWTSSVDPDAVPLALTFWTYVSHDATREIAPEAAWASLQGLHRALRQYPGSLPFMGVVMDEIPHWLKWLEVRHRLSGPDVIALREAHWRLAALLRSSRLPVQALHGDAHRRNLLATPVGLLWTDFEDACMGPRAWDIAVFLAQEPGHEDELLAQLPDPPGWEELLPFVEARELEAVIYMQVAATRSPERAAAAADQLERWQRKILR